MPEFSGHKKSARTAPLNTFVLWMYHNYPFPASRDRVKGNLRHSTPGAWQRQGRNLGVL